MLEWTDLRFLLAIQRARTLSGAARKLGCDQTTVGRRLEALETALEARLFRRTPDGYFPTRDGEAALARAERVEDEVLSLEREVVGRDERPAGLVRLTTYESFGTAFLAPRLGELRTLHPEIDLMLNMDNRPLNLSRREADLAIRPARPSQQPLHIRRIGSVTAGFYAAPAYLKRRGEPRSADDFAGHDIIDDEESSFMLSRWLTPLTRGARTVMRCDSTVAQASAAAAGVGIVVLFCYVGDERRGLKRILPKLELTNELWIAVHRDLQYAARVRAVIDFVVDVAKRDQSVLRGRRSPSAKSQG